MTLSKLILSLLCISLSCTAHTSAVFSLAARCGASEAGVVDAVQPFLSRLHPQDLVTDHAHVAVLITVALNQKFGLQLPLTDVMSAIDNNLAKPDKISFLELRGVLRKLGYDGIGVRGNVSNIDPGNREFVFIVDHKLLPKSPVLTLLFASTERMRYLLYPNGSICPMTAEEFNDYFAEQPMMFVRERVAPPRKVYTLEDFEKPADVPQNRPRPITLKDLGIQ